jgi:threonyl-tRNA synthetase
LVPDQAVVIPVSEKFNAYAEEVAKELKKKDIRVIIDDRNEKIGRKIRDNELKKIPYLLVVGEKEIENNEISIRKQGEGDMGSMKIANFAEIINNEVEKQSLVNL